MKVGTIYSSMDEFRATVRQHAIKRQFQLTTKKSRTNYFSGKCNHEGCSWTISTRLIRDDQQVKVLTLFICSTPTLFTYICERIKMPKRGVNWAFLNFIARIKSY
jgi:hypothetical protein